MNKYKNCSGREPGTIVIHVEGGLVTVYVVNEKGEMVEPLVRPVKVVDFDIDGTPDEELCHCVYGDGQNHHLHGMSKEEGGNL